MSLDYPSWYIVTPGDVGAWGVHMDCGRDVLQCFFAPADNPDLGEMIAAMQAVLEDWRREPSYRGTVWGRFKPDEGLLLA